MMNLLPWICQELLSRTRRKAAGRLFLILWDVKIETNFCLNGSLLAIVLCTVVRFSLPNLAPQALHTTPSFSRWKSGDLLGPLAQCRKAVSLDKNKGRIRCRKVGNNIEGLLQKIGEKLQPPALWNKSTLSTTPWMKGKEEKQQGLSLLVQRLFFQAMRPGCQGPHRNFQPQRDFLIRLSLWSCTENTNSVFYLFYVLFWNHGLLYVFFVCGSVII